MKLPTIQHLMRLFQPSARLMPLLFALHCTSSAPRPVPVGPVPNANGGGATDRHTEPSGDRSDPTFSQSVKNRLGSDVSGLGGTGSDDPPPKKDKAAPDIQTPSPAQPPADPNAAGVTGANCSANYGLGYGDPYQKNGLGPWLAKQKDDYSEECQIATPACTANDGMGYGSKFAHGKLWLAKDSSTFADTSTCIITKLTGT